MSEFEPDRSDPGSSETDSDVWAVAAGSHAPTGDTLELPVVPGAGGRRRRHRWWRVALALVVVLLGYYVFNLVAVWRTGVGDQVRPVDAIVVLGAAQYDGRPSPQLAARLDHVVDLWERDLAPLVVVTGGKQPGDRFTEADASRRYLVDRGVPDAAILEENAAHTTYDSLVGVRDLLVERDLRRVLLVTDPFHSLRSRLIAQEVGLVAYVSPTRTSPVRGAKSFGLHLKEAAGISLGRIIGFDRLTSITG